MAKSIGVLGGGISGLSFAFFLAKPQGVNPLSLTVLESSPRLGGWIKSARHSGLLLESGPQTIRANSESSAYFYYLMHQLEIDGLISLPNRPSGMFLIVDGRMRKLGPSLLLPYLPRIALNAWTAKGLDWSKDVSVQEYGDCRFGARATHEIFSAIVNGVYGGDMSKLSLSACFPRFREMEDRHGSIFKGMLKHKLEFPPDLLDANGHVEKLCRHLSLNRAVTIDGGMETMVRKLAADLDKAGVEIQKSDPVVQILDQSSQIKVVCASGKEFLFDRLISTLPAHALKRASNLASLSEFEAIDIGVVHFVFNVAVNPRAGYGALVPQSEPNCPVHGLMFGFQNGCDICTVMLKPPARGHYAQSADPIEMLVETARSYMEKYLNIEARPLFQVAEIHRNCIPQYYTGHFDRLEKLRLESEERFGGKLSIIGASFTGVGIPDCIKSSYRLARRLLQ